MATTTAPQVTDFTRDVLGRYVCNGLDEALRSTDRTVARPDGRPQIEARPFDLIVIGGGTFGAVVAEHMSFRDRSREHRILVLEGGPVLLPEHQQNLPVLGLNVPTATSIADLKAAGQFGPDKPQQEVWGLPWHSSHPFPGLAYCVGGRSLYWGGWSPELLPEETPTPAWPQAVLDDLRAATLPDGSRGYFRQASDQIGVSETNDFIFGALQRALREQLFAGIEAGQVTDAIALNTLPDHPAVRFARIRHRHRTWQTCSACRLASPAPAAGDARNQLKLEAPLAVQGKSGHAGFFPSNKFSTVPLLIKAAREAYTDSGGDDARKRVMVVPRCHVSRIVTSADGADRRVVAIETNQGTVGRAATRQGHHRARHDRKRAFGACLVWRHPGRGVRSYRDQPDGAPAVESGHSHPAHGVESCRPRSGPAGRRAVRQGPAMLSRAPASTGPFIFRSPPRGSAPSAGILKPSCSRRSRTSIPSTSIARPTTPTS